MAKVKSRYVCQECGASFLKWNGQCGSCKAWNTLAEEVVEVVVRAGRGKLGGSSRIGKVVGLAEVKKRKRPIERMTTGSDELDRVLGGGIVPGSVVLVAGEPGIGKSTLLTQLALQVGVKNKVLYVCGEESVDQVGLRVDRLNQAKVKADKVKIGLLAEMDVDVIVETAFAEKPEVMIVDSIQTLSTRDLSGMSGSVGQVRESATRLISLAKRMGVPVFLVGHVTKEGSIAGPKVLEHMVDAVLTLSGEKTGLWRILRAYKNRFGAVDEVGVFSMGESGLEDVDNPSGAFLEESQAGEPGSAIVALMEGTRPILVEVQALAVQSQLAMPRRVAHGIMISKLQLLTAVLTKQCRLPLGTRDVFVNVAGGLKVDEPAADLAIALAIASSVKAIALPKKTVVIGEVGLLGEIRRVAQLSRRVKEAKKMGYARVVSPANYKGLAEVVRKVLGGKGK